MSRSLFRLEVMEHQRERLWGDVMLTQPLSLRLLSALVALVLAALITYLILGSYTRKETVEGFLTPEAGLVQVHARQPGTLTHVNVSTGDRVEEGDILARISTDTALDDGFTLNAMLVDLLDQQVRQLEQRMERHQQRHETRRLWLERRIERHESQQQQLNRQLGLQDERIGLAESRYEAVQSLRERDLISGEDYETRYQALLDERQQREQLQHNLSMERGELEDARFELDSLDSDTAETLDELRAEITALEQQRLQYRGEHAFTVRAPRAGRVTSLQARLGQLVDPSRPLMIILPEESALQAELFVPSSAIGFMAPELPVRLRYHAFPHERFGIHEATVDRVAETVLSPEQIDAPVQSEVPVYRVTARLTEQDLVAYGRTVALSAGMTVEADILLEERPLYQWILRPFYSLRGTL